MENLFFVWNLSLRNISLWNKFWGFVLFLFLFKDGGVSTSDPIKRRDSMVTSKTPNPLSTKTICFHRFIIIAPLSLYRTIRPKRSKSSFFENKTLPNHRKSYRHIIGTANITKIHQTTSSKPATLWYFHPQVAYDAM